MALTKADLVASLQDELGVSRAECKELVDQFFAVVIETLAQGDEVIVTGFGKFSLHDKHARPGRNPKTGEDALITARRVVTFQASQKLRSKLVGLSPADEGAAHAAPSEKDRQGTNPAA